MFTVAIKKRRTGRRKERGHSCPPSHGTNSFLSRTALLPGGQECPRSLLATQEKATFYFKMR